MVKPMTALAVLSDKLRAAQQAQVPRDRGARDRKSPRNLTGGSASVSEHIQNGSPSGIGKGIEGSLRRMCNRTLTHNT